MIFCSVTTRDRFWHFALTMLCLARAYRPPGLNVVVYDDGSGLDNWPAKEILCDGLLMRGVVQEYYRCDEPTGYNRRFHDIMERVARDTSISHWLHLDDDLAFGADVLVRAVEDYRRWLGRGLLYLFTNAWATEKLRGPCNGPLWHVEELGGASFLTSRETIRCVADTFAGAGADQPHRVLWQRLREAGETLAVNYAQTYAMQHTANADSLQFGQQETWRDAWSHDLRTRALVDVPPWGTVALRAAVDAGRLAEFVRAANHDGTREGTLVLPDALAMSEVLR